MTSLEYRQLDTITRLARDYDNAGVTIRHLDKDGLVEVDLFADDDRLVCRASVTPAGVVRTSRVVGLGEPEELAA